MKKTIALALAFCMCLSLCYPVLASSPKSPMWVNIASIDSSISFSGTSGDASAIVIGRKGTTGISGTLTVFKQSGNDWIYVDSSSGSSNSNTLTLGVYFTGESGAYYKAVLEVVVTRNGVDEPETKTVYRTCP